jgi:hypothetical protein
MPDLDPRRLNEHSSAVRTTIRTCHSPPNGDLVLSRTPFILVLMFTCGATYAQEEQPAVGDGGFLQAPTVEPTPVTGEPVEPDITITESAGNVVYEYRVRGVLYMVKVQPQIGPPYYLYDINGDGMIDVDDRSPKNTAVPQWVLFQWH